MSVTGPDFVALQVRDLDRSARFYTEPPGLPARLNPLDARPLGRQLAR
jgi:hypothetical protein